MWCVCSACLEGKEVCGAANRGGAAATECVKRHQAVVGEAGATGVAYAVLREESGGAAKVKGREAGNSAGSG